jgi:type I restriction enzyme S subunit
MADDFDVQPLGTVARVRSGYAFKSEDMGAVGLPVIKIKNVVPPTVDITDCERVPEEVISSIPRVERFELKEGDTLIAMTGATVGKVGKFPRTHERHFLNQRVGKVFLTEPDAADYRYIYYILSHDTYVRQMFGIADGSAQANISGSQIESLEVPLPPLAEQKAIAAVLGALDDKIELNRRMNATLEAMARALFQSWFVDFDPVRAKLDGRQPVGLDLATAALFPDSFQDSEFGHIPKGWTVQPVGEVVDCVGGGTPSTTDPKYWQGGTHHWTTPKDFSSLQAPVLLDTDRKLTDAGIAKISSGLLPAGTLLLSSRAPVGYLAIAAMPVAINQGFIALKCNHRASNFFMLNWCQTNMAEIESRATGTTFAEISKQNFRPIRVVLPPKEIMAAFTAKVAPLYARITANLHQSHTLATLRDTLLPNLLSGDLKALNE